MRLVGVGRKIFYAEKILRWFKRSEPATHWAIYSPLYFFCEGKQEAFDRYMQCEPAVYRICGYVKASPDFDIFKHELYQKTHSELVEIDGQYTIDELKKIMPANDFKRWFWSEISDLAQMKFGFRLE